MPESIFSRRRFLGACLGAGGVLFMGSGGLLALRGISPRVDGLKVLSDHEFRTLLSLARALFPAAGPFASSADDLELARSFDAFLADEPPWNAGDLKKALVLLEFGPVWMDARPATFSGLTEDERLAHFTRWQLSSTLLLRQAAAGFQRILSMMFYDDPRVWPHIGYDGPMFKVVTP
jgi:hypothetical protein